MQKYQASVSAPELCQDWNFQINLPSNPIKLRVKVALGQSLGVLLPDRVKQLEQGQRPLPYALLDRLIATALADRLLREGRTDVIADMHKSIWKRPDVLAYYATTESWFANRFLTEHVDFVEQLQKVADEGEFHSLCEIGCGRGLLTNYFADQLGRIDRFIGLDLNQPQIEMNRTRFTNPKLEFVATDALTWIKQQMRPGWIVTSYESLLYFSQAEIEDLFVTVANTLAPAAFGIIEILDRKHDLEREPASQAFDGVLHLSHNYPELLKRAGYTVRYQDQRTTGGVRWILILATVG
jgi:SAM-dependent methyltransferase